MRFLPKIFVIGLKLQLSQRRKIIAKCRKLMQKVATTRSGGKWFIDRYIAALLRVRGTPLRVKGTRFLAYLALGEQKVNRKICFGRIL